MARLYGGAVCYPSTYAAAVLHTDRDWATTLGQNTTTGVRSKVRPVMTPKSPLPPRTWSAA